jgi:hypothetical protein
MSQPTEKLDPRVTPPKKYAEPAPKTGAISDDTGDADGSRDDVQRGVDDSRDPTSEPESERVPQSQRPETTRQR